MSTGNINHFADGSSELNKNSSKNEPVLTPPPSPETATTSINEKPKSSYVKWAFDGEGFVGVSDSIKQLSAGMYTILYHNSTYHFYKKELQIDNLMLFDDSECKNIVDEIDIFWNKQLTFKKFGFLHRRGYLLYGPAGSGKTASVQLIVNDLIRRNGIIFLCEDPRLLNRGLEIFRQIEPNRNVICLFEDIDAIIDNYSESSILSLLDGENQIDRVLNIATTNYPEQLDKRIAGRPRRFDRLIYIDMPSASVRKQYFQLKLGIDINELDEWVKLTDKFSFAAMAELVISVKCLGNDLYQSVDTLRNLLMDKKSSDDYSNSPKVGFV